MDDRLRAVLAELRQKRQSGTQSLIPLTFWPNLCRKVACDQGNFDHHRQTDKEIPVISNSDVIPSGGDANFAGKDTKQIVSFDTSSTSGDHSNRRSNQKRKATAPVKFLDVSDRAMFRTESDHDYADFPQSPVQWYEKREVQTKSRKRSNSSCRNRLSKIEPTKDCGVADFHGIQLPFVLREEQKYFVRNHLRQALSKFRSVTSAHFGVACNSMFKSVQCMPEEKAAVAQLCKDLSLNYSNYSCLVSEDDAEKVYEWMRKGPSMSVTPPPPDIESGESLESVESNSQNIDPDHPPLKFVILDKKEMKKKNNKSVEKKTEKSKSQKKKQNSLSQFRKILPKVEKEFDGSASPVKQGEGMWNQDDSPRLHIVTDTTPDMDGKVPEESITCCPVGSQETENSVNEDNATKPPQCKVHPVTQLSPLANSNPGFNITFGASSYLDGVLYETQLDGSGGCSSDSKSGPLSHHPVPRTPGTLGPAASSTPLKQLEDVVKSMPAPLEDRCSCRDQFLMNQENESMVKVESLKEAGAEQSLSPEYPKAEVMHSPKKEKVTGISSPRFATRKDVFSPIGAKTVSSSREMKVKPVAPAATILRPVNPNRSFQKGTYENEGITLPTTLPVTAYLPVQCLCPITGSVERGVLHAYLCKHALSQCIRCMVCEKFFSWIGFSHHSHEGDHSYGHEVETRGRILLDSKDVTPKMLQLWETVLNRVRTQPVPSHQIDMVPRSFLAPKTTASTSKFSHGLAHLASKVQNQAQAGQAAIQEHNDPASTWHLISGTEYPVSVPSSICGDSRMTEPMNVSKSNMSTGKTMQNPATCNPDNPGPQLYPSARTYGPQTTAVSRQFSSPLDMHLQDSAKYPLKSPLFHYLTGNTQTPVSDHNNNITGKSAATGTVPTMATTFPPLEPKMEVPVGVVASQPMDDSLTPSSDNDLNRMRRQLGSHRYFIHHLMEENEYLRNMLNLKTQANSVLMAQVQNLRMRFHRDVAMSKKVIGSLCGWKKVDDVVMDSEDESNTTEDAFVGGPRIS